MPCMKVEPSTQDRTRSDFFNSHISPDARRRYTPMEDTRVAALENSIVRLVWLRRYGATMTITPYMTVIVSGRLSHEILRSDSCQPPRPFQNTQLAASCASPYAKDCAILEHDCTHRIVTWGGVKGDGVPRRLHRRLGGAPLQQINVGLRDQVGFLYAELPHKLLRDDLPRFNRLPRIQHNLKLQK